MIVFAILIYGSVVYLTLGAMFSGFLVPRLIEVARVFEPESVKDMEESPWMGYLVVTIAWLPIVISALLPKRMP